MKKTTFSQCAFFDLDETLIACKSMFSFLRFYYVEMQGESSGNANYEKAYESLKSLARSGVDRKEVNKRYYQLFKGHQRKVILEVGQRWFKINKRQKNFFNQAILNEQKKHQRLGHGVVLVTGSFEACTKPIQNALKVDAVLCIQAAYTNGVYTGEILPPQTIGDGKKEAMSAFLIDHHIHTKNCFAYGDHITDLPMLEYVGNAIVCQTDENEFLQYIAIKKGWSIL